MSDFTVNLINQALDAALMRQTAIANNIANANSQDYQVTRIEFESQLKKVQTNEDLAAVKPQVVTQDADVKIDQEMALSVKNATHYRALIKGINHHFAIMQLAIKG